MESRISLFFRSFPLFHFYFWCNNNIRRRTVESIGDSEDEEELELEDVDEDEEVLEAVDDEGTCGSL